MGLRRTLAATAATAVLAPASASADVRLVERDEPLGAVQARLARPAPLSFNMVGLHWRGPGELWFRTAGRTGPWSPWRPARPEDEDLPDLGSAEARWVDGWNVGNPYWTGASRRIQYRADGRVVRVRAFFISSPATSVPRTAARPALPAIIRRAQWGADESIVRARPSYAGRVRFSVVHHTAGTNSYTAAQSAAIVRGIQRYHVLANGWNDIGYNFLVDKHGQLFEGRVGGIARNVIGAHAQGFNTGSVGVAVLGTYASSRISSAARVALERLLAWRLDVAHVDPLSLVTAASYGNERFPAGTLVRLRAVSGHRDTGYTSCPGTALYGQLGAIARAVEQIGLPKLYDPAVSGRVGGPVRFTARLSSTGSWLVTVRNSAGVVAQGSGVGSAVDWTWDASSAPAEAYTYEISAGADVRPARGNVPAPPPLAVHALRATPSVLTPNGDGSGERTRISFRLSRRATVRVSVFASGVAVRVLVPDQELPPGPVTLTWDGTADDGSAVADRRYRVRVAAAAGSETAVRFADLIVDRTLGGLTVSPARFSPNGDARLETAGVAFELTRPAEVRVRVLAGTRTVRTLLAGSRGAGSQTAVWDGRTRSGRAADGGYAVVVEATTALGTRTLKRRLVLDTTAPRVRILSLRVVRGVTRLRFSLSEPARLRIWYGDRAWYDGDSIVLERGAGQQAVWRRVVAGVVRIAARDTAAIAGRPVLARLG